ncbi:SGNH/GDSL hydrolase family protein [Allomuricauda sp. SCSIO 65647]|uniref:SGNH/GDSL hydrolase family protein n=1 Tax=Allomuricauda sp. SCSIO 65647 TaxID=2908843 RepID=UPI001F32E594|nr:SGNH/GDSL hydrolase family protein [Muricauda sp. SCSIO 65647]UJH67960.1 SGNH/GDSL hydrolase family protein [Muricauda sp. SCSIO 65647]
MLKSSFLTLLLLLCLNLCSYAQNESLSFLAMGDSYTAATGELPKNSWPKLLRALMNKKKQQFDEPHILAKAGWTTTDLLKALDTAQLDPSYDQVALLIGVNNQYRGLPITRFEEEFEQLLQKSIQLANGNAEQVFILTIPDWGVTPFAGFRNRDKISEEVGRYNALITEMSAKKNILVIDITPLSRNMGVNPSLIASDSLHPSKKMYQSWAKKISKKLRKKN